MIDLFQNNLPLLVSMAIHPIAGTVALVIAGRQGGARSSSYYAAGFALGVLAAIIAGRLFSLTGRGGGDGSRMLASKIDLAAGIIIILVAFWSLTLGRKWTKTGYVGGIILKVLPMTDEQLLRKGFVGALLNPKDLAVSVALGVHLGVLNPGPLDSLGIISTIILVAILPLMIPAIVAARGGERGRSLLYRLEAWIRGNLPLASAIVLILMGANMIRTALAHLMRA